MELVHSIWVSSVTGAGLFMSMGLLLSRAFGPKAAASAASPAALEGEREARLRAEAQIAALVQQNDEATRQLTEERSQRAALRARAQGDAQIAEQVVHEKRLHEGARQEVQRLGATLARLEAEANQLRAAASASKAPPADDSARLRAQIAHLGGEIEAYRGQLQQREADLHAVRTQLATAESRGAGVQSQAADLHSARARADAEVVRLREVIRSAEQQAASNAAAAAARAQALEAKLVEHGTKASRADALEREVKQLTAQVAADRAKGNEPPQAAQQLAVAKARIAQLEAKDAQQLAVTQAHAGEAQKLAKQVGALQTQLNDSRAELTIAEHRAHEVTALRADNSAMRLQIAELQKAPAAAPQSLAEVQRRNVELSLKERVLTQRNEEFTVLAAELETLRNRVEHLTAAANESAHLKKLVRDFEAQGFAATLLDENAWTRRPARDVLGPDHLESQLQTKLEALVATTKGCRTAVLADLRGLLIAASGDVTRQEELAAVASLMIYTTERIRDLLPMGEPSALEVVDINRTMLRINWMRMGNEAFLLTTFGVAPAPTEHMESHTQEILGELAGD